VRIGLGLSRSIRRRISANRARGTARLEEAVTAYRAAASRNSPARVPLDWATTQNNLGTVLWALGERQRMPQHLQEALNAVGSAYEVFVKEAGYIQYDAYFADRLEAIRITLSALEP
jgi:hypothetical protein